MSKLPVVLTIAGSDSGGGAGIQADLKTFQAMGCFGTTAITAITCQNTVGVGSVQGVDPSIVTEQIRAVIEDFPVKAAKTGMLYSVEIVRSVIAIWKHYRDLSIPLVVDPIMLSSSGKRLLGEEARKDLLELISLADLVTPNIPEAEAILNRPIESYDHMEDAVLSLHELTGTAVLLKGGHRTEAAMESGEVVDLLYDGTLLKRIAFPFHRSRNTHGTGCTLSAAIAVGLAKGRDLFASVIQAREYLDGAIRFAPDLGKGENRPLNHLWNAGK